MTSTDPKVTKVYVDALAAVEKIFANQNPGLAVSRPNNGETKSWNGVTFVSKMTDPEPGHDLPMFKDDYTVRIISDIEGELCTAIDNGVWIERAPLREVRCTTEFTLLGTHQIQVIGTDPFGASTTVDLSLNITNGTPTVEILHPNSGSTFTTQDEISFTLRISDPDETIPSENIIWKNGNTILGSGKLTTSLNPGINNITVEVRDAFDEITSDTVTVNVVSGLDFPEINIVSSHPNFVNPETPVSFQAVATDTEDGNLSGTSIQWVSSIDGNIGNGASISTTLSGPETPCNPESVVHEITVTATDSDGNSSSTTFFIRVGRFC